MQNIDREVVKTAEQIVENHRHILDFGLKEDKVYFEVEEGGAFHGGLVDEMKQLGYEVAGIYTEEIVFKKSHSKSGGPLVLVPEEISWLDTDSRGRVNLGSGYKNKQVRVAILEVEEDEDE